MKKKRPFFKHYKKIFVNEFHGYSTSRLIKDLLAGLTVAAVALPLALAFGAASVDAENIAFGIAAGLITAIIAGVVIGSLGGGSFQISGPTGAMTVVLGGIVGGKYGISGVFLACFMAGLILFLAGVLRFGKLVQFIPRPVVTGFTSGIAIIIALGQFGNFFGVTLHGESAVEKIYHLFSKQIGDIKIWSVICSLIIIAIMILYPKKLRKFIPGSLVGIIILSVIVAVFKIDVKTIGTIPSSLINSKFLVLSDIDIPMITSLIGPAVTIAALGMIESLLCGVCAAKMKNEKFDSNIELIAQGIGNMIIPFFGGVPATAAIARTSVAIKSGGQTRLTGIFHAIFLIACMFALPSVIAVVPYAALAGVLMVTAWRMNEWASIKTYFKRKMWDAIAMYLITLTATVLLDLTYAIIIGVIASLFIMVKNTKMNIEFSPVVVDGMGDDTDINSSVVVYCTGSLFFANANELGKMIERQADQFERYIFSMRGITYLDVSATETLCELVEKLRSKGKGLCFTGVSENVHLHMQRSGFVEFVGEEHFYTSVDKVLLNCKGESLKYKVGAVC